jgi:predicted acyltransferase
MTGGIAERSLDAPAITSTVAAPPVTRERLVALDVFRGATIAGMLLVNNPGSWGAIYPPLAHAAWHGWTPTDLIFPFFLFIVGVTTHLSLSSRRERGDSDAALLRQVVKRGALIYLFGLLLNAFPFFDPVPGRAWASAFERFGISSVSHAPILDTIRLLGVLQRIGIVYVCTGLIWLYTSVRTQKWIVAALLLGYWALMTLVPVPGENAIGAALLDEPGRNLAAWLDRVVLGEHIYRGTRTYDPEGILSTLPAIGTAMLGVFAATWIRCDRPLTERISTLFAGGAIAMVLGLMWHWAFPINKQLWTSSYVVFTGGMAAVTLATCLWLIDLRGSRWWTKPFVIYGVNPMIAFVGSGMMARLIYSLWKIPVGGGEYVSVQSWIYRNLYLSWIGIPKLASLAFAVTFVLFWLGVLTVLYRRRVFFKV